MRDLEALYRRIFWYVFDKLRPSDRWECAFHGTAFVRVHGTSGRACALCMEEA